MRAMTAALAVGLSLAAFVAQAQSFPTRPLRVIVPQPPGGGTLRGAGLHAD